MKITRVAPWIVNGPADRPTAAGAGSHLSQYVLKSKAKNST